MQTVELPCRRHAIISANNVVVVTTNRCMGNSAQLSWSLPQTETDEVSGFSRTCAGETSEGMGYILIKIVYK